MKGSKAKPQHKSAMLYPIIVCVVSVLVIFVLMIGVLPVFTDTLESLMWKCPLLPRL